MESSAVEGLAGIEIPPVTRRDIRLHPDDRIDSGLGKHLVELLHSPHVAVVGDRHRRHIHLLGQLDQSVHGTCAVKQTVMGMQMQMNKSTHITSFSETLSPKFSITAENQVKTMLFQ